ncbi:MAG: hypothetical protein IJP29_07315 [Lachnospiraceae bacterium]|nr:hypothetical protein [Lachnospiraceae bacterium]
MIVSIFLILVLVIDTIIAVFGDLILIKTKLKCCKKYLAEIDYFTDEVRMNNYGAYTVFVVVKYYDSGEEKKAVIYKDKRDKYGDKIEIVTNGDLTARRSVIFPDKLTIVGTVKDFIVATIFGLFMYEIGDLYAVFGIGILLLAYVLYLIIYPLAREACDEDIKRSLGWPYHK